MNWRVGIRRMTGKKAEVVATLELDGDELEALADGLDADAGDPGLILDLRAAAAEVESQKAERARG
jgi:hypothetical protein